MQLICPWEMARVRRWTFFYIVIEQMNKYTQYQFGRPIPSISSMRSNPTRPIESDPDRPTSNIVPWPLYIGRFRPVRRSNNIFPHACLRCTFCLPIAVLLITKLYGWEPSHRLHTYPGKTASRSSIAPVLLSCLSAYVPCEWILMACS